MSPDAKQVAKSAEGRISRAPTIEEALKEFYPDGSFPWLASGTTTVVGADNSNAAVTTPKRNILIEFVAIDQSVGFFDPGWGTLQVGAFPVWKQTSQQIIAARFHWEFPFLAWWLPAMSDWVYADYGKIFAWVSIEWLNGNRYLLHHYDVAP